MSDDWDRAITTIAAAAVMCQALDETVAGILHEMADDGIDNKDAAKAIQVASVTLMLFIAVRLDVDFAKMANAVNQSIKYGSADQTMQKVDKFIAEMNSTVRKDLH